MVSPQIIGRSDQTQLSVSQNMSITPGKECTIMPVSSQGHLNRFIKTIPVPIVFSLHTRLTWHTLLVTKESMNTETESNGEGTNFFIIHGIATEVEVVEASQWRLLGECRDSF